MDRLMVRLAETADVELSDQTLLHGLRPLMGHADPRTTAIYTRSVGRHLTDTLDDAGWL